MDTYSVAQDGGADRPLYWSEPVRRAMANGDVVATGMELLKSQLGVKLVPVGDNKQPVRHLTPHGVRDATDDPQTWQQWLAVWPDAGLGIVPGETFIVIDDDTGTIDTGALGIDGTWEDRTRRGTHYWARVPAARRGRKAKIAGGDVFAGHGGYVITSPTEPYRPVDTERPIHTLPFDSPLWEVMRPKRTVATLELRPPTQIQQAAARQVIGALRSAPIAIANDAETLMAGIVPTGASASEADYRLALLASFWTDDPAVIAAVLWHSRLPRKKWHRADYLARTIASAQARRVELAADAIARTCELSDTLPIGSEHLPVLDVICLFLERAQIGGDFVRIPVGDVARYCGVSTKTVYRAVCRMEGAGLIESHVQTDCVSGKPVRTRWARLSSADADVVRLEQHATQHRQQAIERSG